MTVREANIAAASQQIFDVAIVGGGINGACLYNRLRCEGRRVILIEKGDFSSGTSQASAMMVWGGLLYLGSLDFKAVYGFSSSRDQMIRELADWTSPRLFRFLPAKHGKLSKWPVLLSLYLYWVIGRFSRIRPSIENVFPEKGLLTRDTIALLFEEGQLRHSDARFVLHWITANASPNSVALNHSELVGGEYHGGERLWHLSVNEHINGKQINVRSHTVINCAGVWTDRVNANFGIGSPYKHALSKGVFLGLERRPEQENPLIFDMGAHDDVITSIPWGPVELWGPTETAITDIEEGLTASGEDVSFLLDQYDRCYRTGATKDNIVSLRCGIRPLAVEASYDRNEYPLELSRRNRIAVDVERPWVSVYGSKITGCEDLAASIVRRIAPLLPEQKTIRIQGSPPPHSPPHLSHCALNFPGLTRTCLLSSGAWSTSTAVPSKTT